MVDISQVSKYIELENKIKELEAEQDILKADIKKDMIADGIDRVTCNNHVLTLTHSSRQTVKKDEFVVWLAKNGLKKYVKVILEPDMDLIHQAKDAGEIKDSEYKSFVKNTDVYTMKVK